MITPTRSAARGAARRSSILERAPRYPVGMVTDPVCGMRIDPDDAVGTVEYNGVTYYFCSEFCRDAFVADPAAYVP